jgi:NADH:ubiquinone oxidoreductase subunit 4 (subunit M)
LWWFLFAIANISAPPSINLLREILLLTSITRTSLSFILILIIISFLAAAYSLILFTHTSHGHTNYLNVPFSPLSPSHYHLFFLHLIPLCVFILCPKIITIWLS